MKIFTWPVRVYYEDTDSGGVVYYANYLRFMERARTEWVRSLGIEQDQLRENEGLIFAVRHVEMDYIKPARFNDMLTVTVSVVECGRASITVAQQIMGQNCGEPIELCKGNVKIACLDAEKFIPRPLPKYLKMEIDSVC